MGYADNVEAQHVPQWTSRIMQIKFQSWNSKETKMLSKHVIFCIYYMRNYCQKVERHRWRLSRLSSSAFSFSVLRSLIHRVQLNLTYLGKELLPTAYSDDDRSLLAFQPLYYGYTPRKNQHSSDRFLRHCILI